MIAFDLDGVLIDIVEQFRKFSLSMYGYELKEFSNYGFDDQLPQEKIDEMLPFIYEDYMGTKIEDDATELFEFVWEKTRRPVKIVTARKSEYATQTYKLVEWFASALFVVCFFGGHSYKNKYLWDCPIFVEDRRKTAVELMQKGKDVILIDRHYNNPLPDEWEGVVRRVKDLDACMDEISCII